MLVVITKSVKNVFYLCSVF